MHKWLATLLLAAVPTFGQAADDKRCLVSFDSAKLNVCTGDVELANESLAHLASVETYADSPIRIVKFDGAITTAQRQSLEGIGAKILGYAPYHAYLVRMAPTLDAAAQDIDGVIWTGPYLPVWKLDINLVNDLGGTDIIQAAQLNRLSISLHEDVEASAARNVLASAPGLTFQFEEKGAREQRVIAQFEYSQLAEAVTALATNPDIASVTLRWQNELFNSQADWLHQSGVEDQMPLFEQGIFGCGQIVGGLDSGLFAANCAFSDETYGQPVTAYCADGAGCAATTPDFDHRKVGAHYRWDGSTSGAPGDGHGHGTHVFGSIAGNNPVDAVDCENLTSPGGLTDLDGTAPGAKIISQEAGASLQYLNSHGGTIYHAASIAYENGARIHNNSWGSSCRNAFGLCTSGCQVEYRDTTRDADQAVWDFPDLALFVAAGNSGGLGGETGCGPGADVGAAGNAKNVFSIGSNRRGTEGHGMSDFSSRGPTSDRRSKPDITAQGGGYPGEAGGDIISAGRTTCGTAPMSGTSMATPTASGLAALVREYLNRGFYPSGIATPGMEIEAPSGALIKAILVAGAQEITGDGTTGGAPSQSQGWGRITLDDALYFDGDEKTLWLHDGTDGLETGDTFSYTLEVGDGQPFVVTLAWHDFPALVNANPHWVNQLRLEVQAPNGDVWTQKLTPGGGLTNPNPFQDTTTADYDDLNNVHRIALDTPAAGAYEIRVRGIQVAQGDAQPFALAATGAIAGLTDPSFLLSAAPGSAAVCAGDPASYTVSVRSFESFDDAVTLTVAGVPSPATGSLSPTSVVPADPAATSTLSIAGTAGVAGGTYPITITGESSGANFPVASKSVNLNLTVASAAPGAPVPQSPADAEANVSTTPTLEWQAAAEAVGYQVQLATDAGFSNIVVDQTVTGTTLTVPTLLDSNTTYYWRVKADNICGDSGWSAVVSFTTLPAPGDCAIGVTPNVVFEEDFTGGLGEFTTTGSIGTSTWAISTARPSPASGGNAVLAQDLTAVSDQYLISPAITLPTDGLPLSLQFQNDQTIEDQSSGTACYDGALLEISTDDGATWGQVPSAAMLTRPYTGPVATAFSSPIAGLDAWCGDPLAWENQIVDLNAYAGQTVRFRWRMATDSSAGRVPDGWYVDDIKVQSCGEPPTDGINLGITLAASPEPVSTGGELTYTVNVANTGPEDATAVEVELTLPTDVSFVEGRAAVSKARPQVRGTDWTCAEASGTVLCELAGPVAAAGGTAPVLTVTALVADDAAPGTVTTTATVTGAETENAPGNNTASVDTEIVGAPEPDDGIFCDGFEDGGDGSCTGGGSGGETGVYDDRVEFLDNVTGAVFEPDFNTNPTGSITAPLVFEGEGFTVTIDSDPAGGGLWGEPGGILTPNAAADGIKLTFSGDPVTAFGANVWGTDISVNPLVATVTITLDDGTVETFEASNADAFRGFVTEAPITSVTLKATSGAATWTTLANVVVGAR